MRLDRAEGDVHAAGDPHIQTDPRNIARVAPALAARLAQLDPANAAFYQDRYRAFDERWRTAITRWEREAAPLRGVAIVVHHKGFTYLERWLGIDEVATLEPVPGIEPTTAHLADVLATMERKPVRMVVRATYQSDRASQWIAERAKIKAVALPATVGGTSAAKDLFRVLRRPNRAPARRRAMNAIEWSILLPAFIAGLLVTATHVPLGSQVLARGIVFVDLAIAQIAGGGVLLADRLGFEPEGIAVPDRRARCGARGRAATHVDRACLANGAGSGDRRCLRACRNGESVVAREQCPRRRAPARSSCRPDTVGHAAATCRRRARVAGRARVWFGAGTRLGRAGFYVVFAVCGHAVGVNSSASTSCSRR